jgi:hypothetical protein
MLSDIPYAQFYSVSAIESPAAPILVGGLKEMNYFADLVDDKQLVLFTGISEQECLLMFNIDWRDLADIVDTAKSNMKDEIEENNNTTN